MAECKEGHRVTLLSSGKDAGGNAKVTAKIQLKSTGAGTAPPSPPSQLSTILFDHDGTDLKKAGDDAGFIEGLTGKLCLSITGNNGRLSSETASTFLTLKSKMRFVSKKVLEDAYTKLRSGKICDAKDARLNKLVTLYVEAAAMASSTDSIAFVADLVKSGAVSKKSQKKFRLFTAFANRPKESALESMRGLLATGGDLNPKYLLTASGIAHQFCLSANCAESSAYKELVNEIAKQVKSNCEASSSGEENKVKAAVIGLQAFGNLDSLTPQAIATISDCLTKSDRIKVHALQAFRRDPCQESIKSVARDILKKEENPAHVRLSAYLALSQCYNQLDSDVIRGLIKTEESVQGVTNLIRNWRI